MAEQEDFERLVDWIKRFNDCVGQVVEEKNTTLTLVDSAEYELSQVRRQLRPSSQLPREALRTLCEPGRTPKGVFNVKLRSPENVCTPQWWAVLGLGE
jgi:hypothetical protein